MGEEEEEQPLGAEDGLEPAIKGFCEGGRNCFHNGGRHRTGAFFNHFLCAQDCSDRVAVLQCITQVMADGGGEVVASSKLVGAVIATSVTTITTILRLSSICLAFSSVTVWMHVDAWLLWWGDTDLDEATAMEQGPLQCSETEVALGNFKVGDMYSKFGARSRGLGLELFSLLIAVIVCCLRVVFNLVDTEATSRAEVARL